MALPATTAAPSLVAPTAARLGLAPSLSCYARLPVVPRLPCDSPLADGPHGGSVEPSARPPRLRSYIRRQQPTRRISDDNNISRLEEVRRHYELLVEDVDGIESGRVPLPTYAVDGAAEEGGGGGGKKGGGVGGAHGDKGSAKSAEQERRKGIAWTEDEHRLFLLGLEKYGKGDWRSISRNFVISRTPTQVASHAQKYFIRLNSMNRERRRSSIHDITSVNNGDASTAQGPITGQTNGAARSI